MRNADAESTITGLPAKFPELGKGFMNPVRGSRFESSREFSGGRGFLTLKGADEHDPILLQYI